MILSCKDYGLSKYVVDRCPKTSGKRIVKPRSLSFPILMSPTRTPLIPITPWQSNAGSHHSALMTTLPMKTKKVKKAWQARRLTS